MKNNQFNAKKNGVQEKKPQILITQIGNYLLQKKQIKNL